MQSALLDKLRALAGQDSIITGVELSRYAIDGRVPECAVFPRSVEDVVAVVQQAAGAGDADAIAVAADQPVVLEGVEALELGGEVGAESDAVAPLDVAEVEAVAAHQRHDDVAPQPVFGGHAQALGDGQAPGRDPREVEDRLMKFTPPEYLKDAHHWLILHGRYVCLARKPGCPQCLIRDLCEYKQKTRDVQPLAR